MKAAISTCGVSKLLPALYFSGFKMGEKEINTEVCSLQGFKWGIKRLKTNQDLVHNF